MNPLFQLTCHVIGRVYLIIRFKTWAKAEEVRDEKYYGSYSTCGSIIMLDLVAGTGAVVLTIFLIITVVGIIYRLITGGIGSLE